MSSTRATDKNNVSIAIDGPAGAGKSTIARQVARRLDFLYIDTGAMYRACAYFAIQQGIALDDEDAIKDMMQQISLSFRSNGDEQRLYVNEVDVSDCIRSQEVTRGSADIAQSAAVRQSLVTIQREIAQSSNVVMDGRDIGSYVLPDADIKIFLTASDEIRARRRYLEMKDREKSLPSFQEVMDELHERDRLDRTRKISPLICADDAVLIQTDQMTVEDVIDHILTLVQSCMFQEADSCQN